MNNAGTATFRNHSKRRRWRSWIGCSTLISHGAFATTQAALKHMKDGGRIINIGSAVGERVQTPGLVPYSATKGAVKIFTQGLSREVRGRGHHGQQRAAGPDRHGFESRVG